MTPEAHRIRHVAVLVPARNEAALLPRCLRSVLAACYALPSSMTADIVVVSDASVDATEAIAAATLRSRGTVLSVAAGNVGLARAAAASVALERYTGSAQSCWLANTDADCEVPAHWLLQQLRHAEQGVAAVAGIVDVDCFAEHLPHVESRFRLTYTLHDDGTHPHVHGANLGVRADVYRQAGEWRGLETAEDHDLWSRICRVTPLHIADARLCVRTSGRRVGRAPLGFAGALAAHNLDAAAETAA